MDDSTAHPDDETNSRNAEPQAAETEDPDAVAGDELPEDMPLTPELVEEEAIRGDFMLRWAAVLLTVLFAFGQFSDTKLLVHIRSGEQMQESALLPPRTDTFSYTTEGAFVPNTTWLLDHVLAGVWQLGGETGLTLLQVAVAMLVAVILSRISVAGLPTWWSSICAVLAAMAIAADFLPGTQLVTLLGVVLLLRWLHQWQEGSARGLTWKIPATVAVWCNLDTHAWVGVLIVVLFALGQTIRQRIAVRRSMTRDAEGSPDSLWLTAGVSVAALLVNPFPLNSLTSPIAYYSIEVPSMRMQRPIASSSELARMSHDHRVDYFSALNPDAVSSFDHTQTAALTLVLLAVVVSLISRHREVLPLLFPMLGLLALSLFVLHELPAAALVAAVLAGTMAQRWYRRSFSMTYTTDTRDVLFSRGGRAATVFAMAFLGFCIVAGRLPGSTPLGVGFEPNTAITIDAIGRQLESVDPEAHILNTRIDQGDILIWHGHRSCIDSRLTPFGRSGNPDSIIAKHRNMLVHLLHPQPPRPPAAPAGPEQQRQYEEALTQFETGVQTATRTLDAYDISHALPRLAPPLPDYRSVMSLAGSGDWMLTDLGSSSALMERISRTWTEKERRDRALDFPEQAFREDPETPVGGLLREFASPPNFYETWVYRRRPVFGEDERMATHYLKLSEVQLGSVDDALSAIAMQTLAIRHCNAALSRDKQNANAWLLLGKAYQRLGDLESGLAASQGGDGSRDLRYYQAVIAFRQAVTIDEDNQEAWNSLFVEYRRRGSIDLASECLDRIDEPRTDLPEGSDAAVEAAAHYEMMRELRDQIRTHENQFAEFQQANPLPDDPAERAQQIVGLAARKAAEGFQRHALDLLQEHADAIRPNPVGQVLLGDLLLQAGDCEQAYQVLNQLASAAREHPQSFFGVDWHVPTAITQIATGNYGEAAAIFDLQLKQFEIADASPETWGTALLTAPLAPEATVAISSRAPAWPLLHTQGLQIPLSGLPSIRAKICLQTARIHLEEGNLDRARLYLRTAISDFGFTPFRTLAIYYLLLVDPNATEFLEANTPNDWEPFSFGDEGTADDAAETASEAAVETSGAAFKTTPAAEPAEDPPSSDDDDAGTTDGSQRPAE